MRRNIYVSVTPRVLAALVRLADRERRRIQVQAAILLERALGIEPEDEEPLAATTWTTSAEARRGGKT